MEAPLPAASTVGGVFYYTQRCEASRCEASDNSGCEDYGRRTAHGISVPPQPPQTQGGGGLIRSAGPRSAILPLVCPSAALFPMRTPKRLPGRAPRRLSDIHPRRGHDVLCGMRATARGHGPRMFTIVARLDTGHDRRPPALTLWIRVWHRREWWGAG